MYFIAISRYFFANFWRSYLEVVSFFFSSTLFYSVAFAQPLMTSGPAYIYSAHQEKTAHIEVIGELYSGERDLINVGSGVRMSSEFVLTSAHLLGNPANYKSRSVNVRLGTRSAAPLTMAIVEVDNERDIALLKFVQAGAIDASKNCPLYIVNERQFVPGGSELFFLGFPIDRSYGIADGLMRSSPPDNGFWETTASLNPGNSGGPAFNRWGNFVGIAKGAVVSFQSNNGNTVDVDGISFFVGSTTILESKIGEILLNTPVDSRCAISIAANSNGTFGLDSTPIPLANAAETIELRTPINGPTMVTGGQLSKYFQALNGYEIVACAFEPIGNEPEQALCTISEDGDYVKYELTGIRTTEGEFGEQIFGRAFVTHKLLAGAPQ